MMIQQHDNVSCRRSTKCLLLIFDYLFITDYVVHICLDNNYTKEIGKSTSVLHMISPQLLEEDRVYYVKLVKLAYYEIS